MQRTPSIRTRLALLVLASVLPAAALVFVLVTYDYQQERAQLKANTVATARAIGFQLDYRIAEVQSGLTALATSRLLRLSDLSYFDQQAREVRAAQPISNIVLVGLDGRQLVNTLRPFGSELPTTFSSPQMQKLLQSGQSGVTDLFTGPVAGKQVIAVGVPVRQDGRVVYGLIAIIEPAQLRDLLLRQNMAPGWVAAILDRTGTVVARTQDQERFVGKPATAELRQRMQQVTADAIENALTLDGRRVVTAFSRAPQSQWVVAIGIPQDTLTAGLNESLGLLLAGTLGLLATSLGLAWYFGSGITHAIKQLTHAARQLAKEEPVAVPRLAFREADELGRAFEQTSMALGQAHEARLHSEARLRGILESAMDSIITIDEEHRVVLFNSAAITMFGWTAAEAMGAPIADFLPERFRNGHANHIQQFGEQHDGARMMSRERVVHGLRRNGEEFPLEASISMVKEGGRRLFTVILRDITERERNREELVRSNLELQQFAFVASHDLRSPLRSINGYIRLLEKKHGAVLPPEAIELVHRTSAAVMQLDRLTDDLLSYARIESQTRPFEDVDTDAALAAAMHLLDAAIAESGAVIEADALPHLRGDRTLLIQLFQNLLANAITFCGTSSPRIRVTAAVFDDRWEFSVTDNGIGIEPQHLQKIFQIFKRLHSGREYPGNGMGLSICERIVQRHGGRIWVESEAGRGSVFLFTIQKATLNATETAT
jgi:PAS domain S-box-containing protein